jgi:hypothetical protein
VTCNGKPEVQKKVVIGVPRTTGPLQLFRLVVMVLDDLAEKTHVASSKVLLKGYYLWKHKHNVELHACS